MVVKSASIGHTILMLFLAVIVWPVALFSQSPAALPAVNPMLVLPRDRVPAAIDNSQIVALPGNVPARARTLTDLGAVPGSLPMNRMILTLTRSSDQQAALDAYSAALQNPKSPWFHKWLTPKTFGEHFGLSQNDLNRLSDWLKGQGFTVDETPSGHWTITFSGTAAQVENAFHTPIHYYSAGAETRYANTTDPQIPKALAGIVSGVTGLHNFQPQHARSITMPAGGSVGSNWLDPSDFASIYNLNPLYGKGIKGNGVQIAVIEACSIDVSLATTFWSLEGLSQNSNAYTYPSAPGAPPQCPTTGNLILEVFLDYEWSGAVAPGATIWLASSNSADILFGAAQETVEATLGGTASTYAQVISMSYQDCESVYDLNNWVPLWQQAHTQGITALVSSGDIGDAACDYPGTGTAATHGLSVNGFCASPYVVCVGGSQFNDTSNPAQYWSSGGQAKGYIPEIAWNQVGILTTASPSEPLWGASGGGYSTIQAKPSWQTGNTSSQRGEPDVAVSAALHDPYRVCYTPNPCGSGSVWLAGGTSAAAPSFAGIMALVIQEAGKQGSPNQTLYNLEAQPSTGVFNDIVSGNNSVPGLPGYSAGPGWDPVTGLGSVNATALVTNWPGVSTSIPLLTNLEMTLQGPPTSGCANPIPSATSAFLTTNNLAYLFFDATVTTSDLLSTEWLAPNGTVLGGSAWPAEAGTFCFDNAAPLVISNLPPAELGQWQAIVYDNGSQIGSVSFTVSAPASAATISGILPSSVVVNSGAFTLTVNGTGFTSGSTVLWNGAGLLTTLQSSTQLTASVTSNLIASVGSASITVTTAGQISNSVTFTISQTISTTGLSRIGVLTQVAAGGGWDTATYLTNTTSGSISVAVSYYFDAGNALTLPLTVTQQGRTQSLSTSTVTAVIPANTTLLIDTGFLSGVVTGWAEVLSNGPITGFAVFRYGPQGLTPGPGVTVPWEGTVPLQTQLSTSLMIVPFDNTNGFSTGVALGNLNASALNLTATFFDQNGVQIGFGQTISLPGNGHTSFLLNSSYPSTANIVGVMKISGAGVAGLGLRASPYGTLTSIPVPIQ